MKKGIVVLILMLAVLQSNAQMGLRLGGIMAKEKVSFLGFGVGNLNAFGFQVGGFYEIPKTESFSLQPEILVSYFSNNATIKSNVTEINVPVLAKITVSPNIKLVFGPQVDFLASAKIASLQTEAQLKKLGFSGQIGGEYQLNDNLSFSLRYSTMIKGFSTKVLDLSSSGLGVLGNLINPTFKTPMVSLTMGYTFGTSLK